MSLESLNVDVDGVIQRRLPGSVYIREIFEVVPDASCARDDDPRHQDAACPTCCSGEWRYGKEEIDPDLWVRTGWLLPMDVGAVIRAKLDRGVPLSEILTE